jgi:hypothetical protein
MLIWAFPGQVLLKLVATSPTSTRQGPVPSVVPSRPSRGPHLRWALQAPNATQKNKPYIYLVKPYA